MFFTRGHKQQLGYAIIIDPAFGQPQEIDSLSCAHCDNVKWMKPFEDGAAMGARCTICDKFICLDCIGKPCTPLEKRLEEIERRHHYNEILKR